MLEALDQFPPLLSRQVMDLLMGRDARPLHCHRNQLLGQQIVQRVAEVVVGVLLKVPQQPLVQGLLIQSRLKSISSR